MMKDSTDDSWSERMISICPVKVTMLPKVPLRLHTTPKTRTVKIPGNLIETANCIR